MIKGSNAGGVGSSWMLEESEDSAGNSGTESLEAGGTLGGSVVVA